MVTGLTHVLVIGLDPRRVPGPWDPEPVVAAIEDGMAALRDEGYDAEACLVGLDGSDDIPERVVAQALGARGWGVVIIGGGIRKDEDLAVLFETVVNLVHRGAPDAAIGFNTRPDDLVETVRRVTSVTYE